MLPTPARKTPVEPFRTMMPIDTRQSACKYTLQVQTSGGTRFVGFTAW
jgi:hypothetical protein